MNNPANWKKILVPTDFSEEALKAVRAACLFQQLTPAEVVLVHVTVPAFDGLRIHTGELHHETRTAASRQLGEIEAAHFPGSTAVSSVVKDGRAGEEICELARTLSVDVIFIATHGITAMKHFVLGSVAEKIVRHAPCSVLVVRE